MTDGRTSARLGWAPLALGAMLGCVVLAIARLVALAADLMGIASGWYPIYFGAACGVAALEAYYGRRLRRRWERSVQGPERWQLIALEVLVLVVVLKLGSYAGDSLSAIRADVLSWLGEPARIVDGETAVALVMAFLSWVVFSRALDALEQLGEPPGRRSVGYWSDAQSGALGLPVPQVRLAATFLWGGVVLLFVTGLLWAGAHVDQGWAGLAVLWDREPGAAPVPIWQVVNVLVYFVLGLVMVSQVRLVALRQDWQERRTGVSRELTGAWWRYSLAFVGLTALGALLLPTGYTTGLLDVLRFALGTVLRALYVVAATLVVAILTPLFWIARWFVGDGVVAPEAPSMASARPQLPPPSGGGPAWLGIARAVFFWIVILGFAVYLVRAFLREHPEVKRALGSFNLQQFAACIGRWLRWLVRLWKAWRARFSQWRVSRARHRREGVLSQEGEGRDSILSTSRAPGSNRGQVLHTYLDLVRLAGRAGFPRRPAQTPLAYGRTLKSELPEHRTDVDTLTNAFVEARYSRHTVEADLVRRVRASWQQIKEMLRRIP